MSTKEKPLIRGNENMAAMNRDLEGLVEAGKVFAFLDDGRWVFWKHALYVSPTRPGTR